MVHASILPHEDTWRRYVGIPSCHLAVHNLMPLSFLKNLKLVAVDELHYYAGIFGRYGILIITALLYVYAIHISVT